MVKIQYVMNWHVNMCELLSEQLMSLSKFCLSFLCAALSSNKIWQKISTTFCKFVSMNGINSMFMSLLRRTSKYASKTVWCYINVHWFAWNLINNGSMYKRQLQSTYCGSLSESNNCGIFLLFKFLHVSSIRHFFYLTPDLVSTGKYRSVSTMKMLALQQCCSNMFI